jgi:glycosyltransferase involved in cell wall biosynthesis
MKIGMVGFRGIPHSYGGNEEFILHLGPRLAAAGHEVIVYCRSGLFDDRAPFYKGVRRVFLPTVEHKSLGQFLHAGLAMIAAVNDGVDLVFIQTLPSAPHSVIPWIFRKPIVVNVDGLEWLRDKWGPIGKSYYRLARDIALHTADELVNDSEVLRQYYLQHYNHDSTFVPYGSEFETSETPELLDRWGLHAGQYFLVISRLVPENNIDMIVRAYKRLDTAKPLIIAGSANFESEWVTGLRDGETDMVRFIGHVFDRRELVELQCNCFAYIHGHSIGGTNPSLVRALGCGNCVVAFASPYNCEVLTGDDGSMFGETFVDEKDLVCAMSRLEEDPDLVTRHRTRSRDRVSQAYTWDQIAKSYEELFQRVIERRTRHQRPN